MLCRRLSRLAGLLRRVPPSDNAPDASPCFLVVGDAFEAAAQLNRSSQFATLIKGGLDRSGVRFGDHEHAQIMGAVVMGCKVVWLFNRLVIIWRGSFWVSGVMVASRDKGPHKGPEQSLSTPTSIMHELKEAEVERQLVLRDATVRTQPGP